MNEDPFALTPEALLLFGAVGTLVVGSFVPRHAQWATRALTALVLMAALVASIVGAGRADLVIYDGLWAVDGVTTVARLIVLPATLLTLCLSIETVRGNKRESEFYVLLLLGALGALALAGASDLLVLAVAYLLASIPLYALAGFARDRTGTEAALKLYLLGAFLGIALLLGVTLLYGVAGGTTYAVLADGLSAAPRAPVALGVVCVLAGLMFKVGAVPGHFWVPDVAQGARGHRAAVRDVGELQVAPGTQHASDFGKYGILLFKTDVTDYVETDHIIETRVRERQVREFSAKSEVVAVASRSLRALWRKINSCQRYSLAL